MLPKIQATMVRMEEKMAAPFLNSKSAIDILEGQIVNPFTLVSLRFHRYVLPRNMFAF